MFNTPKIAEFHGFSCTPTSWHKEQIVLSISVGLGQYDAESNPEDITSGADEALYKAKQAGKNTLRIFEATRNKK